MASSHSSSRRALLRHLGLAPLLASPLTLAARRGTPVDPAAPAILRQSPGKPSDVRIDAVRFEYEEHRYRTPLKFGGTVTDRVTLLNAHCTVSARTGKSAEGFGSMPMGNVWSFPSARLTYDQTLQAMKAVVGRIRDAMAVHSAFGHPIDLTWALEPVWLEAARAVTAALALPEPIPKLCTLTAASPFDAALHDAFGKLHGVSSYETYGPALMTHDLGHYLGPEFRGEWLDQYVSRRPQPRLPLYHLVGAVDPIEASDVSQPIGDGLPETLPEWIRFNGLTHLKIKLNGSDLGWDVERVLRVDGVTAAEQAKRKVSRWVYSLDFNEKCPNVGYLLDFVRQVRAKAPDAFERIQYIEQPTARDLRAHPENVMHEAAKLKPVVADESITDYDSLLLSRDRGYSGVALKACKGQTQALILGAAAQKHRLFLCVQDLTCPGASLVHSAGLAARIRTVAAIEANARQYVPAASKGWEDRHPGLFRITGGTVDTSGLTGPGLAFG